MSHLTGGQASIPEKNLQILFDVLKKLFPDCELVRPIKAGDNTLSMRWYGQWVNDFNDATAAYNNGIDTKEYGKCHYLIKVKGSGYDVGVYKTKNGSYSVYFDAWGSNGARIMEVLGQGASKLGEEYAKELFRREAKANGYTVSYAKNKAGETQVVLKQGTGLGGY